MFPHSRLPFARVVFPCLLFISLTTLVVMAQPDRQFVPTETLHASDATEDDQFGSSVAVDGLTAAVGAPGWNVAGDDYFGSVYVYVQSANGWEEQAHIINDEGLRNDIFGNSVALQGDTLAIAAPYRDQTVPVRVSDAGAVYIYTGAAETWTKQTMLMPDDLVADNNFGRSLDLDNDTLIVGASTYFSTVNEAAYVYRRVGTSWALEEKLSVPGSPEDFGAAVAIHGDVALVGATGPTEGSSLVPGLVYIFTRTGSDWSQTGTLVPAETEVGDNFGCAIDYDGRTAVIASCEAYGTPPDPGVAHLFIRDGETWTQKALLTPDVENRQLNVTSVAIDDDRLVLGAFRAPAPGGIGTSSPGAVFVYERTDGVWEPTQTLYAEGGQDGDAFGRAVALDNNNLLIGAPYDAVLIQPEQGAVYVFRSGSGTGSERILLPVIIRGVPAR